MALVTNKPYEGTTRTLTRQTPLNKCKMLGRGNPTFFLRSAQSVHIVHSVRAVRLVPSTFQVDRIYGTILCSSKPTPLSLQYSSSYGKGRRSVDEAAGSSEKVAP